ncbi:hypothetical protein Tco_0711683, partial [Tanacetum coccineum]
MIERYKEAAVATNRSDGVRGNGYSQKDKNKAKTGQNQARDWKERGNP